MIISWVECDRFRPLDFVMKNFISHLVIIILNSCIINLMYQRSISKKRCQLQLSERSSLWEVTSGLKRSKNGVKSFLNKHLDKKRSKELLFSETISFHTAERSRKHFLRNRWLWYTPLCLGVLISTNYRLRIYFYIPYLW